MWYVTRDRGGNRLLESFLLEFGADTYYSLVRHSGTHLSSYLRAEQRVVLILCHFSGDPPILEAHR